MVTTKPRHRFASGWPPRSPPRAPPDRSPRGPAAPRGPWLRSSARRRTRRPRHAYDARATGRASRRSDRLGHHIEPARLARPRGRVEPRLVGHPPPAGGASGRPDVVPLATQAARRTARDRPRRVVAAGADRGRPRRHRHQHDRARPRGRVVDRRRARRGPAGPTAARAGRAWRAPCGRAPAPAPRRRTRRPSTARPAPPAQASARQAARARGGEGAVRAQQPARALAADAPRPEQQVDSRVDDRVETVEAHGRMPARPARRLNGRRRSLWRARQPTYWTDDTSSGQRHGAAALGPGRVLQSRAVPDVQRLVGRGRPARARDRSGSVGRRRPVEPSTGTPTNWATVGVNWWSTPTMLGVCQPMSRMRWRSTAPQARFRDRRARGRRRRPSEL